jgi:hypothetical protein
VGVLAKGLDYGLGLWRLNTMPAEGSTYYDFIGYLFATHFFDLSTKFGYSIPRPLDLDGIV